MALKITVPNSSSENLTFGSAQTPVAAEVVGIDSGSSNGQLAFKTTFGGASTERMRIDASGNVGIGTSSGTERFTVKSDNTSTFINLQTSSNSGVYLGNNSGIMIMYAGGSERMRIDTSGYATGSVNGNSAGLMQAQQYYRLNSGYVGSNATGAQSLFGVGVTLVGSTVYEFELVMYMTKSAGATSHTIAFGFGGTATVNNVYYQLLGTYGATAPAAANYTSLTQPITTTSSTVVTGAIASAVEYVWYTLKGTVSINAGGTFIPQYTLSAAPGGAYTTQAGSYIKISPLSSSGANTSIGSWA